MMQYTDEIDIIDLFKNILKRWKTIVLLMVICAIAGGIYAMLKPTGGNELIVSEADKAVVEELKEMENLYAEKKAKVVEMMRDSSSGSFSEEDYYYVESVNQFGALISDSLSKLTANQKSYYNQLTAGDTAVKNEENYVKYAALGAIAGVFAACAYICISYCFSDKLRTGKDLSSCFKLYMLGKIESDNSCESESVANNIEYAVKKTGTTRVIVSVPSTEKSKKAFSDVHDKLAGCNFEIAETGPRFDIESVLNDDCNVGLVLFEETGASKYEDINAAITTSNQYDIQILGCVEVE